MCQQGTDLGIADNELGALLYPFLLLYALKYTRIRALTNVEIGCAHCDDSELAYYVQDNGVGFDTEQTGKFMAFSSGSVRKRNFRTPRSSWQLRTASCAATAGACGRKSKWSRSDLLL